MHFRQQQDENLDCFINRCKLMALKCEFEDNELNERLIELIVAGTPIPDYQSCWVKRRLLHWTKQLNLGALMKLVPPTSSRFAIWEQPWRQLSIASNVV